MLPLEVPPPKPISVDDGLLFVNGEWREATGGDRFETINPATEATIATMAKATVEDVNIAVAAARRAFDEGPWTTMPGSRRAQIMNRVADLIEERAMELAVRESMDMGKLYKDAMGIDVPHCARYIRYYAGYTTQLEGSVKPAEGHQASLAYTRREPLGVVAAITPFNFPLILSISKIAPAMAAGNCIIHKPATTTPLTAITLAEIMQEAGVPPGVYNLLTGPGGTIGSALSKHPGVDKIAVTGSTPTGKQIIKDGADTLKHVTAELGGKSPNIIFADADLDKAAFNTYLGIFWNKGEVCVAGSRAIIEHSVYDKFLDKLVGLAERIRVGDPLELSSDYGPMAGKKEFEGVLEYLDIGRKECGDAIVGGDSMTVNGVGYYVQPTIFNAPSNDVTIAQEEIFGPVLTAIPFEDFDDAIRIANDSPYGLAAGVQTSDAGKAIRAAEKIKAGTLWLNCWHRYDPSVPFGGYKESGHGREQGFEAFESYTQTKSIWLDLGA